MLAFRVSDMKIRFWICAAVFVGTGFFHWASAGRKEQSRNKAIPSPESLKLLPGFRAELVYAVPRKTQGTWVSLTQDDRGRLIASAERGRWSINAISPK